MGENPFLSDPNVNKVRSALANLDFLVVQDIFLTETAEFADVILPATSYLEKTRDLYKHRSARADRASRRSRRPERLDSTGRSSVTWLDPASGTPAGSMRASSR